jgi:hypothetical protein
MLLYDRSHEESTNSNIITTKTTSRLERFGSENNVRYATGTLYTAVTETKKSLASFTLGRF